MNPYAWAYLLTGIAAAGMALAVWRDERKPRLYRKRWWRRS